MVILLESLHRASSECLTDNEFIGINKMDILRDGGWVLMKSLELYINDLSILLHNYELYIISPIYVHWL